MSESAIPETWADARKIVLANAPWSLLLVAIERAFEGQFAQAAIALLSCFVALGIAIHWKAFEGLSKPEGRRRLSFILITIGAIVLAAGVYLLATQPPSASDMTLDQAKLVDANKQLQAERAAKEALDKQLAATRSELQEAHRQLDAERQAAPASSVPMPTPSIPSPLLNAAVGPGYNIPLQLTGTFAKSGKILRYVVDFTFDTQSRGQSLRPHTRFKIGESKDFVRGEAVKMPLLSFGPDRSFVKWGAENEPPLPGAENGTVGFNWFVQAVVFAIDENDTEAKVIAFTLWPRMSGSEFMQEMNRTTMSGRSPDKPAEAIRPQTWGDILVFTEGQLRALDPAR